MAKKNNQNETPLDRQVRNGMVRVRALANIPDSLDGDERVNRGQTFECPDWRVKALGKLVEVIK